MDLAGFVDGLGVFTRFMIWFCFMDSAPADPRGTPRSPIEHQEEYQEALAPFQHESLPVLDQIGKCI